MSVDRLLGFAAMSLVLVLIPGPSVLFVLGRALAHGRRTALGSVLGNAAGAYVLAATVSLGLGEVVTRSVAVFTAVKLAGAAYLVFLGVKAWRHRGELSAAVADSGPAGAVTGPGGPGDRVDGGSAGPAGGAVRPPRGDLRTLWEGFVVGVTNPKTCVFFAAVLPQFVSRDGGRGARADAAARAGLHGRGAGVRQPVGADRVGGAHLVRPLPAPDGGGRRHRRSGDDRPRGDGRGHRPRGLLSGVPGGAGGRSAARRRRSGAGRAERQGPETSGHEGGKTP